VQLSLILRGDYFLLKTDCSNGDLIDNESIYLRVQQLWLKHGLRVVNMHGKCYLNFAVDINSNDIRFGVSFFKQHFISFK